ncbi:store-operated calcium entry-associated regulatory factor [Aplochiton taeniatus]
MKGIILILLFVVQVKSWNEGPGSVLLRDVHVLTLYKGRHTAARRSSPVLQLQCVGGSAGCNAFVPEVVQCQNKGWDGVDAQWECKTDMDNAYRFGRIDVTCEGFSHPNDPYVLVGSCGLEYTMELTEEGRRKTHGSSHHGSMGSGGFSGFASSFFNGFSNNKQQQHHYGDQQHHSSSSLGSEDSSGLLGVAVLLLVAYGVYKVFLSGNTAQGGQTEGAGYPGDGGHRDNAFHGNPAGPPPPGFKPDFTGAYEKAMTIEEIHIWQSSGYPGASSYPGANPNYGFHSEYNGHQYPGGRATPGTGGGFWTGMGTGGVLGYLFGSQRRQPPTHAHTTYRPPTNPTASTGTRTASGFGGTKRR